MEWVVEAILALIVFGVAAVSFYAGLKMGRKGYTPPEFTPPPTRVHRPAPDPSFTPIHRRPVAKEEEKEETSELAG